MATAAPRDEEPGSAPSDATAKRPVVQTPMVSPQRNRLLALTLASVVALVFVTVVALGVLFHYAEVHHALAIP
jgi:hypothetical protein